MMNDWSISPILERYLGGGAFVAVVVLAAMLLVAWIVGAMFTRISPWRRSTLMLLRLAVILLVVLAMLRPTRIFTELKKQSATIVLLIDRSRSMGISDAIGDKTRWSVLRKTIDDVLPELEKLKKSRNVTVKVYAFDAGVAAISVEGERIVLDDAPRGDQSDYGAAITEIVRREGRRRLIAAVVLGDGAQQAIATSTTPQTATRALADLGTPLVAVGFGRSRGRGPDVAVKSMTDHSAAVFVKNKLEASGTIKVSGYANRDIPVQLLFETTPGKLEPVAATKVRATRDGEEVPFTLSHTPVSPGEFKMVIRAAEMDREQVTTNNELATIVTVLAGGLRVLYLQGEPRREQAFLRRALDGSPDMEVTLKWVPTATRQRWTEKRAWLREVFEPGKFDVYILGDLDASAFRPEYLEALADRVRGGAGLMMLGGWHTYWPGGYHKTALVDVLPIAVDRRLDSRVDQEFGGFIPPDLHLPGKFRMQPAPPLGTHHYVMRLAPPAENAAAWQKLPRLVGANRFRGVKEGGVVLAESPEGDPLLVAAEPGGRVLAFAGDSTWRWVMRGYADAHRRFWRQAVLWLAKKDQIAQGDVWVKLDGRRFAPGAPVDFTVGANSPEGDPLGGARFQAEVVRPDGTWSRLRLSSEPDQTVGTFRDAIASGDYTLEVSASHDGKEIGRGRARFIVFQKDLELGGTTANPALLANLADMTKEYGGRKIAPEELRSVLAELAAKPIELEEEVRNVVTYWDKWYFFALVVALLSLEWFLRKRWRLV